MSQVRDLVRRLLPRDHSGPEVARLFHRLLALIFLDAWLSLGAQVHLLMGTRGLIPLASFLAHARHTLAWSDFPTLFWLGVNDTTLSLGIVVGVALALLALLGRWPRAVAAAQLVLYLSYATAARTFLRFQWDNLLLECAAFAILLPWDRPAAAVHTLFRLILFKLYWESGIAKWQSDLHDWRDGSAMSWYYETAPLPTALAWYMHHLPAWWHHVESWGTLALELLLPVGIFVGPRRVRLTTFALLTGFQILNATTANYGFFCYLAVALHVFILDDADLARAAAWTRRRLRLAPRAAVAVRARRRLDRVLGGFALAVFLVVSVADGLVSFGESTRLSTTLMPLRRVYAPWRIINTYHLFGSITRARIEPELQTSDDGEHWVAHPLRHKPGAPRRRPDFVAPHQPRVDFQLWFYGLGYRGGAPEYVATLLDRLCRDPDAVRPLFAPPSLSPHPKAARIVYWQYRFTSAEEKRTSGAWWSRQPVDVTDSVPCDSGFAHPLDVDDGD